MSPPEQPRARCSGGQQRNQNSNTVSGYLLLHVPTSCSASAQDAACSSGPSARLTRTMGTIPAAGSRPALNPQSTRTEATERMIAGTVRSVPFCTRN